MRQAFLQLQQSLYVVVKYRAYLFREEMGTPREALYVSRIAENFQLSESRLPEASLNHPYTIFLAYILSQIKVKVNSKMKLKDNLIKEQKNEVKEVKKDA